MHRRSLRQNVRRISSWTFVDENDDEFKLVDFDAIQYTLMAIVGLAGFVDCLATVLPWYLNINEESRPTKTSDGDDGFYWDEFFAPMAIWLDARSLKISFVFSGLWFFNAFYRAHIKKEKALHEKEKRKYLGSKGTEKKPAPNFVYYSTIVWQLVLLPAGFHYMFYYVLERALRGLVMGDLDDLSKQVVIEAKDVDGDGINESESISMETRYSLLVAVMRIVSIKMTGTTFQKIQQDIEFFVKAKVISLVKKLLRRAIRNPFQFQRTVRTTLRAIRWAKYLAPMMGGINKLMGNVENALIKYKQHRLAEKQRKAQKILWEQKSVKLREEEAATKVQAAWRSYCARKVSKLDCIQAIQFTMASDVMFRS
jgi:hypothetical protein